MATKKHNLKSFKTKKARKTRGRKTRGRKGKGGFSLFGNSQCSLGYNKIRNMSNGDIYNPRIQSLYSKCNCRSGSQKSTCINIDYMKNSQGMMNRGVNGMNEMNGMNGNINGMNEMNSMNRMNRYY